MSTEAEERGKLSSGIGGSLHSEVFIGSLVALLTILTALIAYRASIIEGDSDDYTLRGQRTLSEANLAYTEAGQLVMQDFNSYDNYYASSTNDATDNYKTSFSDALAENIDDPSRTPFDELYYDAILAEDSIYDISQLLMLDIISYDHYYASVNLDAADNYYASFSSALVENLEDPSREILFDEQYFDDIYETAYICFGESDSLFEQGEKVGGIAGQYQQVMFIFAIGLAMAAWASLLSESGKMRLMFVILGFAALVYGGLLYWGVSVEASAIPQLVEMTCL